MADREFREGSLDAPTRHPIEWREPNYYDAAALERELERVYDICHGCRRCVSLCNAFPTLFDLVDQSNTLEVDGVAKSDYAKIIDQCYLCDLCYMTKCPYVPPHAWNVDFPHLMLRGKAVKFKQEGASLRDRVLTATDRVGSLAGIPVVAEIVNRVNTLAPARKALEAVLDVHAEAPLPKFHSASARKRLAARAAPSSSADRIGLFVTCYGNRNEPELVTDMVAVFEHNGVAVEVAHQERCCGMPKLELGDLDSVARHAEFNLPSLLALAEQGMRITAPVPSCVLMYRQELPLLLPDDARVARVRAAFVDPYEYLVQLHRAGKLRTDFVNRLGKVAWHAPCHQRVQNIGQKTREVLELVPGTAVLVLDRCSGHDGTYAVKKENYGFARKICAPVVKRIQDGAVDHYVSDCAMAGDLIAHGVAGGRPATSAFALLKHAYGI